MTGAQRALAVELLDQALADAALARRADAHGVTLVDLHLGFVQWPADAPGALVAHGQATGGGRSICFCTAELRDGAGGLVAHAMGTLRYLDHPPSETPGPCT